MSQTLTATLQTNQGNIVIRLFPDHAPKTVRNLVELAEGGRQWTDPRTGRESTNKLYDGTIFHRVIPDFMIQGGDPLGSGRGGPGYQFADEIHPDLRFDRPYLLAMANAGPGTNGSQFFITVGPTTWLNGKHTIFGEVIQGANVVDAISRVKTGSQAVRPTTWSSSRSPSTAPTARPADWTQPVSTPGDPDRVSGVKGISVARAVTAAGCGGGPGFPPATAIPAGKPTSPVSGAAGTPVRTACARPRWASSAWSA